MFSTFSFGNSNAVEIHNKVRSVDAWDTDWKTNDHMKPVTFGVKVRSRNGCLHCKKMKKKCDQQKPTCSMCSRRKVQCVYRNLLEQRTAEKFADGVVKISNKRVIHTSRRPVFTASTQNVFGLNPLDIYLNSSLADIIGPVANDNDDNDESQQQEQLAEEDKVIPLDESQVVENQQTRDGFFNDEELIQILRQIIKGDTSVDRYWVSPTKIDYFKQLKKIYRHSQALLRSPSSSNVFLKLDDLGLLFFENFQHIVGNDISVSPRASDNYFKSLFIPLAEYDETIMYALTAWGGMSLVGSHSRESRKYMETGLAKIAPLELKINNELLKPVSNRNISNTDVLIVLSFYLICIGAEISTGDVEHWTNFMKSCYKILSKIGLKDFLLNSINSHLKESLWLISNFFYHDVTHLSNQATSFSTEEYEEVLVYGGHLMGRQYKSIVDYGIDPLNGCNTALYLLMGEIINEHYEFTNLSKEFEQLETELLKMPNLDGDLSWREVDSITELNSRRQLLLDEFQQTCDSLEHKVQEAKPVLNKLADLDQKSLEWHLTSFELHQLTLRLFINLMLRKKPPASREIQVLLISVLDDIKILLRTGVECALNFPLMIASLCCYKKYDRFLIKDHFRRVLNSDILHYPNLNLERALCVLQEYWKLNPHGQLTVDLYDIVDKFEWELSLL